MFVLKVHRNKFLSFVREYLTSNSRCLICVLGDENKEYSADIEEASENKKRLVMNNNISLKIVATSCRIVGWKHLRKEITENNLIIEKQGFSPNIPKFDNFMCAVV